MTSVKTLKRAALAGFCRALVAGAGLPVALAAPAARAQQVNALPAYVAVVESDDTVLRPAAGELYYPIAKLNKGAMLRVDGETTDSKGNQWFRVWYPQNAWVYVPADSVQADATGKSGTITKLAQPKAPSMLLGFKGSWMPALPQGLQPGTKVTIVETEAGPGGQPVAFKVAPPDTARAFVATGSVRKATAQEAAVFAAGPAGQGLPAAPNTAPQSPPAQANLNEPAAPRPGIGAPANAGNAEPGDTAPVVAIEQTPVQPKPSPYERLESSFQEVRSQPLETAEFTELINEYQAEIDKLEATPASKGIRDGLNQRVQYLKILADLQAARRRLAEQEQTLSTDDQRLRERMAEVDRVRQYTIVGRLSASTLYDGKRLPLMYRIQTIGGPAPRTLAYIKPDEKLSIEGKIGELVGVVGDARLDQTLKLNIITPLRIDTLEPAPKPAEASVPTP